MTFAGDRVSALAKQIGFWVGRNCGRKIGYWVRSVFSWTGRTLVTKCRTWLRWRSGRRALSDKMVPLCTNNHGLVCTACTAHAV